MDHFTFLVAVFCLDDWLKMQPRLRRRGPQPKGLGLFAPRKTSVARWHHPWPRRLIHPRRHAETATGQLTERYHTKRLWTRPPFHLAAR